MGNADSEMCDGCHSVKTCGSSIAIAYRGRHPEKFGVHAAPVAPVAPDDFLNVQLGIPWSEGVKLLDHRYVGDVHAERARREGITREEAKLKNFSERYGMTGKQLAEVMGHTHHTGVKGEEVCIHKGGPRKLEFTHAKDWSWIVFEGMGEALRGKGELYVHKSDDVTIVIKSEYCPAFQISSSYRLHTLFVPGRDKPYDRDKVKIPENHRTRVRRALMAYERHCGVTNHGIPGWYMDGRKIMAMGDMVDGYDPAVVGADKTAVQFVNAETTSEGAAMINKKVSTWVADLTAAKAAFEKAVTEQVGDLDAKVTAAWAELKADTKKTSVTVEFQDPANATPFVKQYDEVTAMLKGSSDDVMSDENINKSCACSIINMLSVDRQMQNLKNNYSVKRIVIQRG